MQIYFSALQKCDVDLCQLPLLLSLGSNVVNMFRNISQSFMREKQMFSLTFFIYFILKITKRILLVGGGYKSKRL